MEKPILFNTEMVRAILDGRKTSTRRIIKPQPPKFVDWLERKVDGFKAYMTPGEPCDYPLVKLSYQPGDILWVRETWMPETEQGICTGSYIYKASDNPEADGDCPLKWRPSIHMPRKVARIFLKVTNVRVERLQEITEEDAIREGCIALKDKNEITSISAKERFHALWDGIYLKQGYGWDANPWVWVYEFERI